MAVVPAIAADSARIYVYARRETAAGSWLTISCGSEAVAKLKRGYFFALAVAPGRHTISVEGGVPLVVEARTGEDVLVRLDWSYSVSRPPIPVLSAVRAEQARTEMKFLTYIDAGKMVSNAVANTDPRDPTAPGFKQREKR